MFAATYANANLDGDVLRTVQLRLRRQCAKFSVAGKSVNAGRTIYPANVVGGNNLSAAEDNNCGTNAANAHNAGDNAAIYLVDQLAISVGLSAVLDNDECHADNSATMAASNGKSQLAKTLPLPEV